MKNPLDILDPELLAPNLSEEEKALRDMFVIEYVKDYDAFQACIRLGFMAAYANEYSQRFLEEPYVQQQIAAVQRKQQLGDDDQREQDRMLIMSVLRQALQNGPYASRVAAAKQLAVMHGLDQIENDSGEKQLIDAFKDFAANIQKVGKQDDVGKQDG